MTALMCDSTGSELLIILKHNDEVYKECFTGKTGHSPLIMSLVDSVLKRAGIKVDDVDVFAACVGPGSFTGIRIGLACFNALAYATGKKRIEINSFEILTYDCADGLYRIDAGSNNSYLCLKEGDSLKLSFLEGTDGSLKFEQQNADRAGAFITVTEKKFKNKEFSSNLKPIYLRKSQAERMADVKN